MDLPKHIKPYPKYFKYLPISSSGFTTLMFKTIYLSEDIIEDLRKPNPKPFSVSVLIHQEIHAKDANLFKMLQYILSKKYRIKEEVTAYSEMFHYLKQHNEIFNLDKAAKSFSKLRYLWMMSYEEGKELITRIWQEA